MSTTHRYDEIREEVAEAYSEPANPRDMPWWQQHGRRWRRVVGLPKLTAENVLIEAAGLLRSIHPNTFQGQPDVQARLLRLRDEVSDLGATVAQRSWQAFKESERNDG